MNAGHGNGSGATNWGDLASAWDAASFDAAAKAPPDSESHLRLVSTLLKTVASSHAEVISNRGGNFVRFDKGLSILTQHAKSQGYDALILFLDELILWLAMNSADLGFVKREAAKLTNLVEAQSADRPIPLVSFVARQRDLRELVGDHVPGAEKLSFSDSLDWQGGRFDTITLEDRNLPAIAEKRVLKCKTTAARQQLDAAFEQTARMKDNVMNILLTQEGDRQMFRHSRPGGSNLQCGVGRPRRPAGQGADRDQRNGDGRMCWPGGRTRRKSGGDQLGSVCRDRQVRG